MPSPWHRCDRYFLRGSDQVTVGPIMQAHPTTAGAAHLLIHSNDRMGASKSSHESALHRLRAFCAIGSRQQKPTALRLQILDLQGQQVFAMEDAGLLTKILLPAGTYHVIACRGRVLRCYTMTLDNGASFDLHLHLVTDSR